MLEWRVLPMHRADAGVCSCGDARCASPGKHPATAHGVKDATSAFFDVRDMFEDRPWANVAVAPGRASGIVVLDVDPRNGGNESLVRFVADRGPIPPCPTVRTGGGGRHYYLACPRGGFRSRELSTLGYPGIDLLSDGKLAVAPPSVHKSGRPHEWEVEPW